MEWFITRIYLSSQFDVVVSWREGRLPLFLPSLVFCLPVQVPRGHQHCHRSHYPPSQLYVLYNNSCLRVCLSISTSISYLTFFRPAWRSSTACLFPRILPFSGPTTPGQQRLCTPRQHQTVPWTNSNDFNGRFKARSCSKFVEPLDFRYRCGQVFFGEMAGGRLKDG